MPGGGSAGGGGANDPRQWNNGLRNRPACFFPRAKRAAIIMSRLRHGIPAEKLVPRPSKGRRTPERRFGVAQLKANLHGSLPMITPDESSKMNWMSGFLFSGVSRARARNESGYLNRAFEPIIIKRHSLLERHAAARERVTMVKVPVPGRVPDLGHCCLGS